jgi:hypothetical protein
MIHNLRYLLVSRELLLVFITETIAIFNKTSLKRLRMVLRDEIINSPEGLNIFFEAKLENIATT